MNKSLISVLMPAYNAEKYISSAIESILNQSFKDFEFIIIDDCSIDNTWSVIQQYAKKDKRIKISQNKNNCYIAANRNKLIQQSRGKYIAWADADDISLPNRLKEQFIFLEKNMEVGIVGGFLEFIDQGGKTTSIRKYAMDDKTLRSSIFRYSPVAQPAAMIRKKCLDELGLYNLDYPPAEDIDMSFRIGTKYQFANLPEVLIKYREHSDSATFNKLKKVELSTLKIRNKFANRMGYKMSPFDRIYNIIQYLTIFIVPTKVKIKIFNLLRNS